MELVKIKITRTISTQRYGTLSPGDILRTDLQFARYVVVDCNAGSFINTSSVNQEKPRNKINKKK